MITIVVYNLLISRKLFEIAKKRRAMEQKAAEGATGGLGYVQQIASGASP